MTPEKTLSPARLSAPLLMALALAGCTVGPEYKKPEVTMPTEFRSQPTTAEAASFADLPWWTVFEDKELQDLVTEALANNHDIEVAVARIEQARALVSVSQSQSKPQVGYTVFAGGERTAGPSLGANVDGRTYGAFGGGLEAAWEFDIWGRIKHQTEAAEANAFAQEEVRNGVILLLVSDIATGYFRLLELDRELVIARESGQVYGKTLDLFTERFKAGRDNNLPVQRTQAAYESSTATIQDLERAITQQENAISVLLGGYPRPIRRGRPLTEQTAPATPVGLTTDLLQRRPDIRGAEQTMMQANAEIGVAVANRYPRIGLSALLGGQGIGVSGDFGVFGVGNILGSVAGPIFTGGRLEAQYKSRQAFWDETVAAYRQTIVVAFRETSDALVAQRTLVERRAALERQVDALRQSSDLALMRYDAGRASYFEVLEAQQELFPAEDALAQTQRDQLLAVVSLYKALGGGWKPSPTAPAQASEGPGETVPAASSGWRPAEDAYTRASAEPTGAASASGGR